MSSSTNRWVKYVLLGLFVVLLLAFLYASYNFAMSLQELAATVEAVAAKAESALATAQTVEARGAPVAGAETAVAAAETAVAAALPTTTPPPAPTGPMIPLDGGVGITYQTADGYGMVLYPVDDWAVYRNYADFESDWLLNGPATVWLALIETQEDPEEWQLFHAKPISGIEVAPTGWSEYTLLVELYLAGTEEGETAGRPSLVDGELVFDEAPKQKIVHSTPFTVEPGLTTGDSLDILEDNGAELDLSSRLLLADDSTGVTKYTLIIFDPVAGAGGGRFRRWCSRCRGCGWFCRRIY